MSFAVYAPSGEGLCCFGVIRGVFSSFRTQPCGFQAGFVPKSSDLPQKFARFGNFDRASGIPSLLGTRMALATIGLAAIDATKGLA